MERYLACEADSVGTEKRHYHRPRPAAVPAQRPRGGYPFRPRKRGSAPPLSAFGERRDIKFEEFFQTLRLPSGDASNRFSDFWVGFGQTRSPKITP